MIDSINNSDTKVTSDRLPPDVFVVVPAYNEAPRIGPVLEKLLEVASTVVVVDDGSRDNTSEVVRRYPVWLLRHVVNLGAGAATQTGITFALQKGAQYIGTFDADGQHIPADLLTLYNIAVTTETNVVFGSRFAGRAVGMPLTRKIMLRVVSGLTYLLCGVWVTDVTTGLRLLDRKAAQSIHITMNRFEHPIDILHQIRKNNLRYAEAPATILYTEECLSKGQRTSAVMRLAMKVFAEEVMR
jgi:glycosyltransferase involved in cell wall biosynthesis